MKLKISTFKEPKHTAVVTCVCWNNTEDVFSCSDDHKLLKWNLINNECMTVAAFAEDFFPTSMNLFPKTGQSGVKHQHDVILISTADGKFHIVNHNGRIEKSVVAHQGACLTAQWSPDGAGLLTGGEDGFVKIWSRNGLLRSSIVQSDVPCFNAKWSPDSGAILYTKGNCLVIKHLNSNSKINKWKAHEGLILCVAWNPNHNLIISGGEDGYAKIWDTFGQQVSISVKHDQPLTSVTWSPTGNMFVLGSYNLIRLCDLNGRSYCLDRPSTGSIYSISWSSDGTQLAAACANCHVLFAHIIEREYTWRSYACKQITRKMITIKNIITDQSDQLDYPDRVIQIALGFNHLVIATVKQCFIHKLTSWNTPVTFDLKEGSISMILLAERCICVVERAGVSVYSYMGRLLASPRIPRPETIGQATISLGPDTLAVIDHADRKLIQVFDLPTGLIVRSSTDNTVTKLTHKMTVSCIALSQTGPLNERQLALLDYNRDLYVVTVKETKPKMFKLGPQVLSITWSSETELLVGLRANSVVAWCCPRAATQPDWLTLTTVSKDISDLGRNPSIMNIEDGVVCVRRGNGSLLRISLASFPEKLLKHIAANMWDDALQLCRTVEDETLWACLAVLAWQYNQLPVAEEAFALIHQYHQVYYIQHLRNAIPEKLTTSQTLNSKTVLSN
ncbi:intraflagellar transport protein 80 homolog isoform X1 [Pieris brassicae]|uniref:intraflagellar transport protein 80 homolog isoform X1 n=2 Tax=Pieris brassicae TaxID=7116 RepID=UPI001E65F2F1|nr:intraflagellar transport protein 80 homolog isoform X1 [Pieris brassicae]